MTMKTIPPTIRVTLSRLNPDSYYSPDMAGKEALIENFVGCYILYAASVETPNPALTRVFMKLLHGELLTGTETKLFIYSILIFNDNMLDECYKYCGALSRILMKTEGRNE